MFMVDQIRLMVNLLRLLSLFVCFIRTEIVSLVEFILWVQFKDLFISLMSIENDTLGIKYAIALALMVIPMLSAIDDYNKHKKQIESVFVELWK